MSFERKYRGVCVDGVHITNAGTRGNEGRKQAKWFHECTCDEWQHTGKPCSHALALLTTQRGTDYEDYVHEYFSVARFRVAYQGEIEPFTDKARWPGVHLDFQLEAPSTKRTAGRQRKNRIKGALERGVSRPRNPDKCKKCGVLGHRQAGCPSNGVKKRWVHLQF